jgi:hypothetical protein
MPSTANDLRQCTADVPRMKLHNAGGQRCSQLRAIPAKQLTIRAEQALSDVLSR